MKHLTLRLLAAALIGIAGTAAAQTPATSAPAGATVPAADASTDAQAAQVLASEGATMLVRGASYSTPVRREVPIRSGDRIRTGPDGHVQLRFLDGALISIQPGSDFRVEQYAFDATRQRSFFELMQGQVRAVSGSIGKRDRADWRMKTPTATIGIRGTEFTVAETACPRGGCAAGTDEGLVVVVIAGRVAVTNAAGTVEVPAGSTLKLRDAATVPTLASAPRAVQGRAQRGGAGAAEPFGPPVPATPGGYEGPPDDAPGRR